MAGDKNKFFDIETFGVRENRRAAPARGPNGRFCGAGRARGGDVHIIYFGDNDLKKRALIRNVLIFSLSAKRVRGRGDFVKIDDWRGSAEDLRWLVRSALDRISPSARFVLTSFRPARGGDFY